LSNLEKTQRVDSTSIGRGWSRNAREHVGPLGSVTVPVMEPVIV
jgi:hypothetical protein